MVMLTLRCGRAVGKGKMSHNNINNRSAKQQEKQREETQSCKIPGSWVPELEAEVCRQREVCRLSSTVGVEGRLVRAEVSTEAWAQEMHRSINPTDGRREITNPNHHGQIDYSKQLINTSFFFF